MQLFSKCPTQNDLNDFIYATAINGNTTIAVDVAGTGNQANAVDLVILEGILNIDLSSNGDLV